MSLVLAPHYIYCIVTKVGHVTFTDKQHFRPCNLFRPCKLVGPPMFGPSDVIESEFVCIGDVFKS